MAIVWGPYQNHVRIGIDITQSPASVGSGTYNVNLNIDVYAQTDGSTSIYNSSSVAFSGWWSGGWGFQLNVGPGQTQLIHRVTLNEATATSPRALWYGVQINHMFGGTFFRRDWTIAARPSAPPPKPGTPGTPTVSRSSDTRHTVSWSSSSTLTSAIVQRQENDGSWKKVAQPSGNVRSWVDTTTKANRRYRYRVAGVNAGGTSAFSGASAAVQTTPAALSGVTATRSGTSIIVGGSGLPAYATHFDIEDNGTVVGSAIARASLPWTHTAPSPAVSHRYRIRPRVASGGSNSSTLIGAWSPYSGTVQTAAPPAAPTGLAPNGNVIDLNSDAVRFSWRHNPVDASPQSAWNLRWRAAGTTTWNETTQGTGGDQFADLIPGLLFAGQAGTYEWQVRTKGAHADWSPWSTTATANVIDAPQVTITSPEGLVDSPTPLIVWEWFQGQGRPQSAWEAHLLTATAEPVETLTGMGAVSQVRFAARLEDRATYLVRVRAATGGVWSAWAEQEFAVRFVSPAPPMLAVEWNDDEGSHSLSVGHGLRDEGADIVNSFANSRFRAPSPGTVEVFRNLVRRSAISVSTAGWTAGTGGTSATPAFQGLRQYQWASGASAAGPLVSMTAPYRAAFAAGQVASAAFGVGNVSTNGYEITVALRLSFFDSSGVVLANADSVPAVIPAGEQAMLVVEGAVAPPNTAFAAIELRREASFPELPAGAKINVYNGMSIVRHPKSPGLFTGAMGNEDPDLTPSWTGTGNDSESILSGRAVAGVTTSGCIAIQSDRYEGAMRLIATATSGTPWAAVDVPTEARGGGVAIATRVQPEVLAPVAAFPFGLLVSTGSGTNYENAAGEIDLRVEYPALTGTYTVTLYHGGLAGSADVYWTRLGLFPPTWDGDYFDGDTGTVETPGGLKGTTWTAVPWESTSITVTLPLAESVDILRSVDGGMTWETVIEGTDPSTNIEDFEGLSHGLTMYRAIGYAAVTGASAFSDVSELAESLALWLSGGDRYEMTARLPYSPTVKLAASRARAIQQYEGRPRGVAYAGEHVTRTVNASGVLLEGDDRSATVDRMEALAQADAPLHLYRDPDGRRIYGVLSGLSLPRQEGSSGAMLWGWSFELEETDH